MARQISRPAVVASVGRIVRAIESMAKLGGAVISGMSDAPNFAYEMAYQGQGLCILSCAACP